MLVLVVAAADLFFAGGPLHAPDAICLSRVSCLRYTRLEVQYAPERRRKQQLKRRLQPLLQANNILTFYPSTAGGALSGILIFVIPEVYVHRKMCR